MKIKDVGGKAVVKLPRDGCLTSKPLETGDWEVSLQDGDGELVRAPWRKDRPLSERHGRRDPQLREALAELDGVEDAKTLLEAEIQPGIAGPEQEALEALKEQRKKERGKKEKEAKARVDLSTKETVVLNGDGVTLRKYGETRSGDRYLKDEKKVIQGDFEPKRHLQLDGDDIFEVETRKAFRGTAVEVLQKLREEGAVVNRARDADAVNAMLTGLGLPREKGHAAYGAYRGHEDPDELDLCLDPEPRSETHEMVKKTIEEAVDAAASKEQLEKWLKVPGFWDTYEALPAMGMAVVAPFGKVLKSEGKMVPHLFHLSPESGLGKTEVLRIYTKVLFGRTLENSDSIGSDYRLADVFDSYGGLIGVEEGEDFKWRKFSAALQRGAEQPLFDRRGTGSMGSRPFYSRAALAFSGNKFPVDKKALLTRFIKIEYNRAKAGERREKANRKELRDLERGLEPIGWRVVETIAGKYGTVDALIDAVETHEDAIEDSYGEVFRDPRRAEAWAVVYEGLQGWGRLADRVGVEWAAPGYAEFVESVVAPIEVQAFETVQAPVSHFANWWAQWKASKKRVRETEEGEIEDVEGKYETWKPGRVETVDGEEVEGDFLTTAITDLYEKRNRHKGPWASITLTDLRKGVEARAGVTDDEVPSTTRIDGQPQYVAFLPNVILSTKGALGQNRITVLQDQETDDQKCNTEKKPISRKKQTTSEERNTVIRSQGGAPKKSKSKDDNAKHRGESIDGLDRLRDAAAVLDKQHLKDAVGRPECPICGTTFTRDEGAFVLAQHCQKEHDAPKDTEKLEKWAVAQGEP